MRSDVLRSPSTSLTATRAGATGSSSSRAARTVTLSSLTVAAARVDRHQGQLLEQGDRARHRSTHDNGLHGIGLSTSTNNLISGNTTYANTSVNPNATAVGIDINTSSPDNTISGNVTYQNQDSGVQVYSSSHRALVVRNISYGNGDHGFDTLDVDRRPVRQQHVVRATGGTGSPSRATRPARP